MSRACIYARDPFANRVWSKKVAGIADRLAGEPVPCGGVVS